MSEYKLGPMTPHDPIRLAALHKAAFPEFFLSQLGVRFLSEFYAGFLSDETSIAIVARDGDGRPVGAAVGTSEPEGFYGRLLRERFVGLALASAGAAIRNPKAILRLMRGAFYRGGVGDEIKPTGALLSSICTSPKARGARLGRQLLEEWERQAVEHGSTTAHLSTDSQDNDATNSFYSSAGWTVDREYQTREGRSMNLYRKALDP